MEVFKFPNDKIEFLDKVCFGGWKMNSNGEVDVDGDVIMTDLNMTEIPVKFGRVYGNFSCSNNNLTTLKNCPDYIGDMLYCQRNNLKEYFKNLKEEDFPHWDKMMWSKNVEQMPFLINIAKKYLNKNKLKYYLKDYPLTKLYYKD